MSQSLLSAAYSEEDFQALEATLLASERGRWFLAEHARRRSRLETRSLVASLERLERFVDDRATAGDAVARELEGITAALVQMTQEIVGPPDPENRKDPFGRIVLEAERASELVASAGARVDEIAEALERQGVEREVADALHAQCEVVREAMTVHAANARRVKALAEILIYARRRLAALAGNVAESEAA